MSGEHVARALGDHFEAIRRDELARLRRKLASLSEEDRAEVDAITACVVQAIAAGPVRALAHDASPLLVRTVIDLFHVS